MPQGEARAAPVRRGVVGFAIAASTALLAVAGAWLVADVALQAPRVTQARQLPLSAEEALALDRVAQLQSQSQALDELLVQFGDRPVVERAGTGVPIDTLEAQVQWLDHQLSSGAGQTQPVSAETLWRERVEAMNSLVRLRYVEAQRIAM